MDVACDYSAHFDGLRRACLTEGDLHPNQKQSTQTTPAGVAQQDLGSNAHAQEQLQGAGTADYETPLLDATQEELQALKEFPGYQEDWHQANDALIAKVTQEFNDKKGWTPEHPDYLDPNMVKAWALQESGGHKDVFSSGDMMQVNNPGDWVEFKENFGMTKREKMTPESSLRAALEWAYHKGEITRSKQANSDPEWHDTQRGSASIKGYESQFTNWDTALDAYNGGGVANYSDMVRKRERGGVDARTA